MTGSPSPRPLRVLHIAPTPFFADRGCHIRIRNEIESLPREQVEVTLCTYQHGRDIEGIRTVRIGRIPGYTSLGVGFSPFKFPADLLLFFLVLRQAIRIRPDILHGHLHEGALIGWFVRTLLFRRKISLVMDVQGSLSGELASYGTFRRFPALLRLFRMAERVVYRLPDRFLCSSARSRDTLVNEFGVEPGLTFLLEDVVADFCGRETLGRQDLRIPPDKKVLVYSGSLLAGKGIDTLMYLLENLPGQRDDLFFLLIGYPVEELQAFIDRQGLGASCLLTGRLEYEKLLSYLVLADLAVEPKLAASGEASGKTLHYMAAGLPVVCFDTENNRRLLGDSGYYAEPGSNRSLTELVIQALDEPETASRKGAVAREKVRQRFSKDACRNLLLDHYADLSGRKGIRVTRSAM